MCGLMWAIVVHSASIFIDSSIISMRRCFNPGDLNEARSVMTVIFEDPGTLDHRPLVYYAATYLLAPRLPQHADHLVIRSYIKPRRAATIRQMNGSEDDVMVTNGRCPYRTVSVPSETRRCGGTLKKVIYLSVIFMWTDPSAYTIMQNLNKSTNSKREPMSTFNSRSS
ncbi:hypothetical protein BDN67DRAFT_467240 [Paxillus ammoniavirescens]|nr:hypothetical protein BDN67DRAFT_467240 [Paxillus ammoniavirescens]